MPTDFRDILDSLNNPAMRHAMLLHLPVVLSSLCVALTLLAAILPLNRTCRWFAIMGCAMLTVSAFLTAQSGEDAQAAMSAAASPDVYALVDRHEEVAEKIWWLAAVILVLVFVGGWLKPMLRATCSWAAVIFSVALAGWVAVAAHLGGTLVYSHGVGVHLPPPAVRPAPAVPFPASSNPAATQPNDPRVAFFNANVAPILVDHCLKCHNPGRSRRSGRLDQTSHEGMMKGGSSGAAIVPGHPEESLLIERVRHVSMEDDPMPPPPNPALSEEQIKILEQWIADGAAWGEIQWSRPPARTP